MPRLSPKLALTAALALLPVGCPEPPREPKSSATVGSLGPASVGGPREPQPSEALPVTADDPQQGPSLAPVTIVVFSDYQCPYCSRFEATLKQVRTTYGDKVRIVWKDLPLAFHKEAMPSAILARAIFMLRGNDAFWAAHDTLFSSQSHLGDPLYADIEAAAGVTDGDIDRVGEAARGKIADSKELGNRVGADGTPAFFIDGVRFVGAKRLEDMRAAIDGHLALAESMLSSGTAPEALYAAMVARHYTAPPPPPPPPEVVIDATVWSVPVGDAPTLGPKTAPVTMVVFGDYQCPFCRKLEITTTELRKKYGDKLRVVWKDNPLAFHDRALPAATFARQARKQKGDAAFWVAHDKFLAKTAKLDDDELSALAKEQGLDWTKIKTAIDKDTERAAITRDVEEGDLVGVGGTPHAFVNGRSINGAQAITVFSKVIDEEIGKAEAKIKSGTAADKLYDELVAQGKSSLITPPPIPAWAPSKGPKDAKVVIQVWSDFQCPFCKRAVIESTADDGTKSGGGATEAFEKYKGKVRVVFRHFPLSFHERALPAAEFASSVFAQKGSDAFWKVHDALFASQPNLADSDLETIATKGRIDWKKCKAAIDGATYQSQIDKDMADGTAIGVTGTPSFLIGRRLVVGAQSAETLERRIEAALAAAK